jgi:glutamine synthetase
MLGASWSYNVENNFDPFMKKCPNIKFVFVQWLDFLGQMRTRCLPISEFERMVKANRAIAISKGNLGTLQNDHMSSVCNPVGAIHVYPDLRSLRPMQNLGPIKNAATVMAGFTDDAALPLPLCPRSALNELVSQFKAEHSCEFLVGFEIEITFCKRNKDSPDVFEPLDSTHAWGTFTDEQYTESMNLMLEITNALRGMGTNIITMHSEAGAGQYEFVLPPYSPVRAVDTLIQARQCIMQIAATRNLRATCHPTPFTGIGTAAHAHISINRVADSTEDISWTEMPFMASVLDHIPALCAFTMPQAASYGRVIDDSWTGGTWIAWGTQNREVPLRKVEDLRWEVRCLDGFANMYLALAAIFAAGLMGVRRKTEMQLGNCPSKFSTPVS